MTRLAVALVLVIAACGGKAKGAQISTIPAHPLTVADQILALLPQGVQVVVELDLARLRANPTVGAVVTRALVSDKLPTFGVGDTVVLAAYGVGTAEAATLTVIASKTPVPGATRITDALYAMGPEDWVAQLEARAALSVTGKQLTAPADLLALRDHAMPAEAPGASLRLTARLPFDARVSLARQTGLESAPAQLSIWADVVDDVAIIIDADALDPGEGRGPKAAKQSTARLIRIIRGALAVVAGDPTTQALGLPGSLANARLVARGTWVRTIIAIGPKHLQRVVERATALLGKGPS
jgi:hypothetical protein